MPVHISHKKFFENLTCSIKSLFALVVEKSTLHFLQKYFLQQLNRAYKCTQPENVSCVHLQATYIQLTSAIIKRVIKRCFFKLSVQRFLKFYAGPKKRRLLFNNLYANYLLLNLAGTYSSFANLNTIIVLECKHVSNWFLYNIINISYIFLPLLVFEIINQTKVRSF